MRDVTNFLFASHQLVADVSNSQRAGTGAIKNTKILSTCGGGRRVHIVLPRVQLVCFSVFLAEPLVFFGCLVFAFGEYNYIIQACLFNLIIV